MLPEIVKRAMVETVVSIGQLSKADKYQLDKYVKKGWLSKGKGGPFPAIKTVYAHPDYDFAANRQAWIDYLLTLGRMDAIAKASRRRER